MKDEQNKSITEESFNYFLSRLEEYLGCRCIVTTDNCLVSVTELDDAERPRFQHPPRYRDEWEEILDEADEDEARWMQEDMEFCFGDDEEDNEFDE